MSIKLSLLAVAVASFTTFSSTYAQSCKPIRLDQAGGPLEHVSVVNQSNLAICQYATSADIIAAQLYYSSDRSQKAQVSFVSLAASVATVAGLEELNDKIRGEEILQHSRMVSVCTEESVQRVFQRANTDALCNESGETAVSLGVVNAERTKKACDYDPNSETNFILRDILKVKTTSPSEISAALKNACSLISLNKSLLPDAERVPGFWFTPSERPSALKRTIDRILDSTNPMPVGVRYCMKFLFDRTHTGVHQDDGKHSEYICGRGNFHASSIIGRRQGKNSCQYLIKNSHGANCNFYDKAHACEAGKIWVNEDDLLRNTTGLFFFKK